MQVGEPADLWCKCMHLVLTASLPEAQTQPEWEQDSLSAHATDSGLGQAASRELGNGRLKPVVWKKGWNPISYAFLVSSQKIKCERTEDISTLAEWQLDRHLKWH